MSKHIDNNSKAVTMPSLARRARFLFAPLIVAAIIAVIALTSTTPAFAINGRDAVGVCIDSTASGARCVWNVDNNGAIDICNKGGCVHCDSAESECTVAAKIHRPTRTLPVGTTVTTELGSFKVTNRVHKGPLSDGSSGGK